MIQLRNSNDVTGVCRGYWIVAENIAIGEVARTRDHVFTIVVYSPEAAVVCGEGCCGAETPAIRTRDTSPRA